MRKKPPLRAARGKTEEDVIIGKVDDAMRRSAAIGPPVIPDPVDLLHRLDMVAPGSCSCNTPRQPDIRQHHEICRYRLLGESAQVLRSLIDFRANLGDAP